MHRTSLARCTLLAAFTGCLLLGGFAAPRDFEPLFEAHPFASWKVVGGAANFSFETINADQSTLIGKGPIERNGFLVSPFAVRNFVLVVDVKIGAEMNSGIQIRSRIEDNAVRGLQVEIDPSDRKWSGGIYDEGGKGWLASLKDKPEAQAAFKVDGWNAFRIECEGPVIRTSINDVPCAQWLECKTLSGVLAFQVHSGPKCEVAWRNPRIELRGWHTYRALPESACVQVENVQTITLPKDAEGFAIDATGACTLHLCTREGKEIVAFEADLSKCEGEVAKAVGELFVVWTSGQGRAVASDLALEFSIPVGVEIASVQVRTTGDAVLRAPRALVRGQW
ncbi:MAG: DUF1080 domain-containing protein [Phycisphaerales bacterium]|nr:DUF1080 domain-containing protein [Phycisphaerales bacterium]